MMMHSRTVIRCTRHLQEALRSPCREERTCPPMPLNQPLQ
jgi:hypothetical protein